MSFSLIIRIPDTRLESNPAFIQVAGVSVLTRLILGAARAGADQITVLGAHITEALRQFGGDRRLKKLDLHWGSTEINPFADVTVDANVVVGNTVWELLVKSAVSAFVPGAPHMVRSGNTSLHPLWNGQTDVSAYVAPVLNMQDARIAKRAIFANVTKPTSGPVSRKINSHLSLPISKALSEIGITPNQMTATTTVLGFISAWYFAQGTFFHIAIGGFLFQLCAALDRVDGELARGTFMASPRGAWIDTIGDSMVYIAFVICLTIGYHRYAISQQLIVVEWILPLGVGMSVLTATLLGSMALYLIHHRQPGTMAIIQPNIRNKVDDAEVGWTYKTLRRFEVLGKRDSFSLCIFLLAGAPLITNNPATYHILFWGCIGTVCLMNLYFAVSIYKTRAS